MLTNKTIIFIHQNFPGQFPHLCEKLAVDNTVYFISKPSKNRIKGVTLLPYNPHRKVHEGVHAYMRMVEDAVLNAQGVARVLLKCKQDGIKPDLIVGHTGWGETMFVKDIFPAVPLLGYFEFFYHAQGADVNFDPEYPSASDIAFRLRARNQPLLSALDSADHGFSPTRWQQSQIPELYRSKVSVIHEGVDTDALVPNPNRTLVLPNVTLKPGQKIVTYVARNLEPYRGFHTVMRSIAEICERNPDAHIIIVGGDGISYGAKLPEGQTYKSIELAKHPVDESRVHFTGRLPYDAFKALLQVSAAHIYLTYPFVLSWSMLEAMSSQCLVIGSKTAPVEEVITDGQNGVLVDFFDHAAIADAVTDALNHPDRYRSMREAARKTVVERYDLRRVSLPRQVELMGSMLR